MLVQFPVQGTCLGCRPGLELGAHERQPHIDVSLSLPFSLNVNKIFLKFWAKKCALYMAKYGLYLAAGTFQIVPGARVTANTKYLSWRSLHTVGEVNSQFPPVGEILPHLLPHSMPLRSHSKGSHRGTTKDPRCLGWKGFLKPRVLPPLWKT